MTKEQTKFLYLIADSIGTTAIEDFSCKSGEKMREIIRSLEQEPTTQEILSHIDTGITATGQSDSYCVGFCNALIWLKSCITHEEPQYFEDVKER